MSWGEFSTLLAGLMAKTPLGEIIQIRSEENEEILKNFTPEQRKIRDDWRLKLIEKQHKEVDTMTEEEKLQEVKKVQELFAKAFGNK